MPANPSFAGQTNQWLVVHDPACEHPRVSWQTADDAAEAANKAGVPPGGYADVANEAEVVPFKRQPLAPLISCRYIHSA